MHRQDPSLARDDEVVRLPVCLTRPPLARSPARLPACPRRPLRGRYERQRSVRHQALQREAAEEVGQAGQVAVGQRVVEVAQVFAADRLGDPGPPGASCASCPDEPVPTRATPGGPGGRPAPRRLARRGGRPRRRRRTAARSTPSTPRPDRPAPDSALPRRASARHRRSPAPPRAAVLPATPGRRFGAGRGELGPHAPAMAAEQIEQEDRSAGGRGHQDGAPVQLRQRAAEKSATLWTGPSQVIARSGSR